MMRRDDLGFIDCVISIEIVLPNHRVNKEWLVEICCGHVEEIILLHNHAGIEEPFLVLPLVEIPDCMLQILMILSLV